MNILTFTLLQASAPAGAGQPQGAGGGAFWIMIIAMFVIMWLFMIRPQRKQQKELEKFRNSLKRGDKVVTAGGIVGIVITVKDDMVLLESSGDKTKIQVQKWAISSILEKAE